MRLVEIFTIFFLTLPLDCAFNKHNEYDLCEDEYCNP